MSDIVIPSDKFARLYEKTVCGYAELFEGAFSLKECERLYDCADQFDHTCREILEINGDWNPEVQVVMDRSWLALQAAFDAATEAFTEEDDDEL
jgi:hypothetical protein|nr:MAG TPA: hypothetical protein [Caudoviricetes sp.]